MKYVAIWQHKHSYAMWNQNVYVYVHVQIQIERYILQHLIIWSMIAGVVS